MIHCGVLKKDLYGTICPIEKGHCYWQHRKTKECCYTNEKMDKQNFCIYLGIDHVPNQEEIDQTKVKMQKALKDYR